MNSTAALLIARFHYITGAVQTSLQWAKGVEVCLPPLVVENDNSSSIVRADQIYSRSVLWQYRKVLN